MQVIKFIIRDNKKKKHFYKIDINYKICLTFEEIYNKKTDIEHP